MEEDQGDAPDLDWTPLKSCRRLCDGDAEHATEPQFSLNLAHPRTHASATGWPPRRQQTKDCIRQSQTINARQSNVCTQSVATRATPIHRLDEASGRGQRRKFKADRFGYSDGIGRASASPLTLAKPYRQRVPQQLRNWGPVASFVCHEDAVCGRIDVAWQNLGTLS